MPWHSNQGEYLDRLIAEGKSEHPQCDLIPGGSYNDEWKALNYLLREEYKLAVSDIKGSIYYLLFSLRYSMLECVNRVHLLIQLKETSKQKLGPHMNTTCIQVVLWNSLV